MSDHSAVVVTPHWPSVMNVGKVHVRGEECDLV